MEKKLNNSSGSDTSLSSTDVRNLFHACDKDADGYLDQCDLEEVRQQLGLEHDITEILKQVGGSQREKISFEDFSQFMKQLAHEVNVGNTSSSESNSAPELSESEMQSPKLRSSKELFSVRPRSFDETCKFNFQKSALGSADFEKYAKHENLSLSSKPPRNVITDISHLQRGSKPEFKRQRVKQPADYDGGSQSMTQYLDSDTLMQLQKLQVLGASGAQENLAHMEQPRGTHYFEIANRLHLAALTSLQDEINQLSIQLRTTCHENDRLRTQITNLNVEKQKMQKDFENRLQKESMRVIELQSVIMELKRKLSEDSDKKIIEEEDEGDDASHCPSDLEAEEGSSNRSECSHQSLECPFDDCIRHMKEDETLPTLSKVQEKSKESKGDAITGVVTSTIREKPVPNLDEADEISALQLESESKGQDPTSVVPITAGERPSATQCLEQRIAALEEENLDLERRLGSLKIRDGGEFDSTEFALKEEVNSLKKERNVLQGRLRQCEEELQEMKAVNTSINEEWEKLKRKTRNLQESIDRKSFHSAPSPAQSPISPLYSSFPSFMSSDHTSLAKSPYPQSTDSVNKAAIIAASLSSGHSVSSANGDSRPQSISILPDSSIRSGSLSLKSSSLDTGFQSSGLSPFAQPSTAQLPKPRDVSDNESKPNFVNSSDLGSSIGEELQGTDFSRCLRSSLEGRIPDDLLRVLLQYKQLDQILCALLAHFESVVADQNQEKTLTVESLRSQVSHHKSQRDILQLCLEESKTNLEKLSILLGKYESNNTALHLALQNSDNLIEAYEIMLQLQESEQDILVANYHMVGVNQFNTDTLKSLTSTHSSKSNASAASSTCMQYNFAFDDFLPDEEEGLAMFRNSEMKRRDVETQAKSLLLKLDKKYDGSVTSPSSLSSHVWEDGQSNKSRVSNSSRNSSVNTDKDDETRTKDSGTSFSKEEEMRLKDYVQMLRSERKIVESTIVELESIQNVLSDVEKPASAEEDNLTQSLDLETAVLIQEVESLKEERSEMKYRMYLLEKEKVGLELRLNTCKAQEQAYRLHIDHLKGEFKEEVKRRKQIIKASLKLQGNSQSTQETEDVSTCSGSSSPCSTLEKMLLTDGNSENHEATKRERKMKQRVQELLQALEKLSKSSDIKHRQKDEYISDLKRANCTLVSAYDKTKKRYAARLKKFESKIMQMDEEHRQQLRKYRERSESLERDLALSKKMQTSV